MKLNRRDFIKFLGKAAIASGVVVVSGLPDKVSEDSEPLGEKTNWISNPSFKASDSFNDNPVEFEDSELYEGGTIRTSGYGHTWRPLHIASNDDMVYVDMSLHPPKSML